MAGRSYQIIDGFNGYRAREENTLLGPQTLVQGSQNVVINTAGRVASVRGYATDGDESQTPDNGIQASYGFDTGKNYRRNMRAGFLNAGNDAKLQFRYKDPVTAVVSWKSILTSLASASFSFDGNYWDITDSVKLLLFVNGDGTMYEWNGSVVLAASTGVNTLTKQGTTTWQQEGSYSTRNRVYTNIRTGVDFTYTGGQTTTILTGVTPDPSLADIVVGDMFVQKVVQTLITTFLPAAIQTFKPTLIKRGVKNQMYIGQSDSNVVWVSGVNAYMNYSFTAPTRIVGEGYTYYLDAPPRAFVPQELGATFDAGMIIYAGKDWIYREKSTLSSDLTKEVLEIKPLRTGRLQGSLSEKAVVRMKNGIAYISNDNVVNLLGQIDQQYVPMLTDLSAAIINDMIAYDFTGAALFYHRNYLYMTVPKSGLIRIYNMTNPNAKIEFWEAPVGYPLSDLYVTQDGEIGGHGYGSSESYLLFTGYRFRANSVDEGFPIDARAFFAPYPHRKHIQGMRGYFPNRTENKATEEMWADGYISESTTLTMGLKFDLDGCSTVKIKQLLGSDLRAVCLPAGDGGLGEAIHGGNPLGGVNAAAALPPYFNVIKTFDKTPNRFEQSFFTSYGIDFRWELISYATDSLPAKEDQTDIRD